MTREPRRARQKTHTYELFTIISSLVQVVGTEGVPVDITAGALFRQLPNVTLYETTIPIVFKIPFQPGRDLHAMYQYLEATCNWTCKDSKAILRRAMANWEWDNWADTFGESHLSKDGAAFATSFALPERRHTGRMVITEQEAKSMEQDIEELGGKWEMDTLMIRATHQRRVENEANRLELLGVLTLIRTQADILRSCQNRRLDPMVIDVNNLRDKLSKANRKVRTDGYELAVKHLSRYYILSLLDCLLSPIHLYLILLIPLKRQSYIPTLQTFLPIPFAREGHTCGIRMQTMDFAISAEAKRIRTRVLDCNPHKDELCLLGDPLGETLAAVRCAEAMVRGGSAAALTLVCPIDCAPSGDMVITKISTTTYVITNPPTSAKVQCSRARNRSDWAVENVGAFRVDLPCDCVLRLGDAEFRPQYPCLSKSDEVVIHRIIPAPWATIPSLTLPPYDSLNFATCGELQDCLESSWKPVTTIHPILAVCSLVMSIVSVLGTMYIMYRLLSRRKRRSRSDPFIRSVPKGKSETCVSFRRPLCPQTVAPKPPTAAPKPPPIEKIPSRCPPSPPTVSPRPVYCEIKEPDYLPMRELKCGNH